MVCQALFHLYLTTFPMYHSNVAHNILNILLLSVSKPNILIFSHSSTYLSILLPIKWCTITSSFAPMKKFCLIVFRLRVALCLLWSRDFFPFLSAELSVRAYETLIYNVCLFSISPLKYKLIEFISGYITKV